MPKEGKILSDSIFPLLLNVTKRKAYRYFTQFGITFHKDIGLFNHTVCKFVYMHVYLKTNQVLIYLMISDKFDSTNI